MKPQFSYTPLALALSLTTPLATLPLMAQAEQTQQISQQLTLNIPSGPLTRTLNKIAQQAGQAISYEATLTANKTAPAIQGTYSLPQALAQALKGTGLQAVKKVSGGYTLVAPHRSSNQTTDNAAAVEQNTVELDSLMVIGTAEHGYTAPESVSATRTYVPLEDTPRSVQVLSQPFIKDSNVGRLEDALMYIPGVERANDLGQLEHSVTIRGFSSDGMVFRDGKRKKYGGQIDMNMVDRIEVVKGPASVQFGTNSPGGIVNVITKRPQAQTLREVELRLDEHGGREVLADMTGAVNDNENLLFRVIASVEDSDSHRDFSEVKARTLAPSLRYLIDEDTLLDVVYQHQYSKRPINQGLYQDNITRRDQIPTGLANANFGEPGDSGKYSNNLFDITLQHQFNPALRAEVSYVYSQQDLETQSTDAFDYQVADTLVDGQLLRKGTVLRDRFGYTDQSTQSHQVSAVLHGDMDLANINHLFSIGLDYATAKSDGDWYFADTHDQSSGVPLFNIFNPVYGQYLGDKDTDTLETRKSKELGLFINESAYLTDDLIVNLGLRYDKISAKGTDTYTDGSDTDRWDNEESDYSWNSGVLYKLIPEASLYASYATSFEPNYDQPDVGEHKNQRGKQWEIGLKGDINGELLYSLAYYHLTKSNIEKELPDGSVRLVGEQRSKGLEVDISYDIDTEWRLLASYAYTDAKYTKDPEQPELEGNQVAGVAPHAAALFTSYSLDKHVSGLTLIGGMKYRGEAPFNDANDFDTQAFTTVDVGVKYQLPLAKGNSLKVQAGVQNLTDEEGIWTDTWSINYSQPRTFYLNAAYQF